MNAKITYTLTDEAPALATYSLLPIIKQFVGAAGVKLETSDISLAARVIANFADHLSEQQRLPDSLAELGQLALTPQANIIKLPNISASIPQLKATIKELQQKGYALPDYPDEPQNDEENRIKSRYDKIKGSAVNPVLREGNSDRRAPPSVKNYARKHPHSMGEWHTQSKTHVASMQSGDFFANEKSITMDNADQLRIELHPASGEPLVLKQSVAVQAGEIIDATYMSIKTLREFIEQQIEHAKQQGVLFSLHLKATMMKVSDPIIFGHAVSVFYQPVLDKHAKLFEQLGVELNNGIGDLYNRIKDLPEDKQAEINQDMQSLYASRPALAMVNSDNGITNLHVPSDVIIDASMPAMIRTSGQMWNADGEQQDSKAVIPDRCYAAVYQQTIDFCKQHGAFDPATMGSVANVGLMAQKAEEYGSHDKTFEIPEKGVVKVIDQSGNCLLQHTLEKGDIWRMCQVKDEPIQDWVKLAVKRARLTNTPAIFWLNKQRAHDQQLIKKVESYLQQHDTNGLEIHIMSPQQATEFTLQRVKQGKDSISVTGNVLRDYLTDLFPILELGTSAKMLSIVPLMKGGGLFETGAGGSAPKHVQQLVAENHLRWDSLGEFLALAASLEHLAANSSNAKASLLAETLDAATGRLLDENKSPSRKVMQLDNRGSHFYLALYWAQALAEQQQDMQLNQQFSEIAEQLLENKAKILEELIEVQGKPVELGGYYQLEPNLVNQVMRPSKTLNQIIAAIG